MVSGINDYMLLRNGKIFNEFFSVTLTTHAKLPLYVKKLELHCQKNISREVSI
jgi:hypothetical protein